MSWWQRWQESDSIKNLLGIFLPPNTCAELGKNGPLGPSPSPSTLAAGINGFWMRARDCQRESRRYRAAIPKTTRTARQIVTLTIARLVPEGNQPRLPAQSANKIPAPAKLRTMC